MTIIKAKNFLFFFKLFKLLEKVLNFTLEFFCRF